MTESWSVSLSSRALSRLRYSSTNVSLVTVLLALSAMGAADVALGNNRSCSFGDVGSGRHSFGDGERGGILGVGGLLWEWSRDRTLKPSLPEFEFHSSTEADPVLDLGELVRLSIGTKERPKSGLSRIGIGYRLKMGVFKVETS